MKRWGLRQRNARWSIFYKKTSGIVVYQTEEIRQDFEYGYVSCIFELSDEDTSKYFTDKKIWKCGNIYNLLLVAGYLKTTKKELQGDGSYLCEVSIPNKEIAAVYKSEILSHLLQIGAITRTTANRIAESLYANDHQELQMAIAEYMDRSISLYDAGAD